MKRFTLPNPDRMDEEQNPPFPSLRRQHAPAKTFPNDTGPHKIDISISFGFSCAENLFDAEWQDFVLRFHPHIQFSFMQPLASTPHGHRIMQDGSFYTAWLHLLASCKTICFQVFLHQVIEDFSQRIVFNRDLFQQFVRMHQEAQPPSMASSEHPALEKRRAQWKGREGKVQEEPTREMAEQCDAYFHYY